MDFDDVNRKEAAYGIAMAAIVVMSVVAGFSVMGVGYNDSEAYRKSLLLVPAQNPYQVPGAVAVGVTDNRTTENALAANEPAGGTGVLISLSTDSYTYSSGQKMTMQVNVSGGYGNAELKLYGIAARSGSYKVNIADVIEMGDFSGTYDVYMPSCYGCAGVAPGVYAIKAEVSQGSVLAETEATVELKP